MRATQGSIRRNHSLPEMKRKYFDRLHACANISMRSTNSTHCIAHENALHSLQRPAALEIPGIHATTFSIIEKTSRLCAA